MATGRPSSGWIKGIVKEVVSGDTLNITSGPKLGAPEKRITLASLIAPKLVLSTATACSTPRSKSFGLRNARETLARGQMRRSLHIAALVQYSFWIVLHLYSTVSGIRLVGG